jgi:hypothetical protein
MIKRHPGRREAAIRDRASNSLFADEGPGSPLASAGMTMVVT